jgi:hypothetical protein
LFNFLWERNGTILKLGYLYKETTLLFGQGCFEFILVLAGMELLHLSGLIEGFINDTWMIFRKIKY